MAKAEEIIKKLEEKDFMGFASDNGLSADEILLPEVEDSDVVYEEFAIVPAGKYEMLVRESERLAAVTRYVCSDKPCMAAIKALLEVE